MSKSSLPVSSSGSGIFRDASGFFFAAFFLGGGAKLALAKGSSSGGVADWSKSSWSLGAGGVCFRSSLP